jgi:hypothetical protein
MADNGRQGRQRGFVVSAKPLLLIVDAVISLPSEVLTNKRVIVLPRQFRVGKESLTYDQQRPLAHQRWSAHTHGSAQPAPVSYPAFLHYVNQLLDAQYAILTLHLPETFDANAHQATIARRFVNSEDIAVAQIPALSLGATYIAERLAWFCKQPDVSLGQAVAFFNWLVAHLETILIDGGHDLPFITSSASTINQWQARLRSKLRLSLFDKHLLTFTAIGYTSLPDLEMTALQPWLRLDRPQEVLLKGNFDDPVFAKLKQTLPALNLTTNGTQDPGLETWYMPQRFLELCLAPDKMEIQRVAKRLLRG